MNQIEERCAAQLRQLRKKRGLTLRECEELSAGKFKSVVLGSYERGTRAISLERLQELADFYEVSIQYFFVVEKIDSTDSLRRYTFDLRKLKNSPFSDIGFVRLLHLLEYFAQKRNDWNGEVLSIRNSDGELLPVITNDHEIIEKLRFHAIFFGSKD